jgi:hypothetical protein
MDTLITFSIVAVAGLWGASRLLSHFTRKPAASCASCCGGCNGPVADAAGQAEGCRVPGDASRRSGFAGGIPLPSRDDRRS